MTALIPYFFPNPKRGDFNLNDEEVYLILDEEQSQEAERILEKEKTLYVDCEGYHFGNTDQKLGAIQIATPSGKCFVFYVTRYNGCLDTLRPLLESNEVRKVFHDCSGDSSVLYANGIQLRGVDDTQIAHKIIQSNISGKPINEETGPALHELYKYYCDGKMPKNSSNTSKTAKGEIKWFRLFEPTEKMMKKATVDVLALRKIFNAQENHLNFLRDLQYMSLVDAQRRRKLRPLPQSLISEAAALYTFDESDSDSETEGDSCTSDETDSDPETSYHSRGGMGDWICANMTTVNNVGRSPWNTETSSMNPANPVRRSPRNTETSSINWGWLAVGAAAVITVGAIAASSAERRSEEERRNNPGNSSAKNKQEKDECTIS